MRAPAGVYPTPRGVAALLGALGLIGVSGLLGGLGCGDRSEGADAASAAEPAPAFELEQLAGGTVALAGLRGKTVILDFWATWCPPCEFQVPELNAFYDAHREESDVAVYGISVDSEGVDVVAAWVAEKEVRYPILLGEGDELARRFGAVGFPTLYIIDPQGRVDSVHVGLIERDELEAALGRLRTSSEAGRS